MCECGQTCPTQDDGVGSTKNPEITDKTPPLIADMDATNIIIFNKQSNGSSTHVMDNETSTTEPSLEMLNATHSSLQSSPTYATNITDSTNRTVSDIQQGNQTNSGKLNTTNELITNKISHNAIRSKFVSRSNIRISKAQPGVLKKDENNFSTTTEAAATTQQARSVNKERHHLASDVLSAALTTEQTPPPQHSDKLFVLDRDTLWGMLREVVHVELDKKQLNLDDKSNQSDHMDKSDID